MALTYVINSDAFQQNQRKRFHNNTVQFPDWDRESNMVAVSLFGDMMAVVTSCENQEYI